MTAERIYLDNAATSWPKPEAVYSAVDRYQRELGAPAGRSAYHQANEVERAIADARRRTSLWIGAEDSRHLVFSFNGTDSLNLALHGILQAGDHVVTTVVEHNSILRPLRYLENSAGVEVSRVACGSDGVIDPDAVAAAIRPNTRMIALIHASNVTGAIQPVEEVGRIARARGLIYLVDAAQTVGHVPVRIDDIGADLLAAPAHKGLLAPLGIGILYVRPRLASQLRTVRQGGTGTKSEDDNQPESLPDRYESGSHNVPAIIGLGAAMTYLENQGAEAIRNHEQALTARLLDGLQEIATVSVHGPADANRQVGVVSITVNAWEPQELAMTLDAACSIQTRAGFQCAPLMHRALGTANLGGTLRLSLGHFNTTDQVDAVITAIAELAATAP